jgi:hypothetical protein
LPASTYRFSPANHMERAMPRPRTAMLVASPDAGLVLVPHDDPGT